jgi:monothiol glutaredoxin
MTTKIPLPIANPEYGSPVPPASAAPRSEGGDVMSEIRHEIGANRVFLYMKGTPMMPMCGFSARVAQILNHLGVEYGSCNVLEDPEKREAIKVFGNWPTIPQLYVDGELVGGCDIVTEMFQSGELQELMGAAR